jgi:phage gp29-like protein
MLRTQDTPQRRLGAAPRAEVLPNPDEILARHSGHKGLALYREMEQNDPTVAAAVRIRRSVVAGRPRRLEPNGAPEPIVAFVRDALALIEDLDGDLAELLDAVPFGYAVSEAELVQRGDAGGRPLLMPVRLLSRDPADYVFDAAGNLRLLTARSPVEGEPLPPAPKFLAVAYNPRHENPYGTAELRCLYWPYFLKRNAAKFWAVALEKGGMPFLLARLRRQLPEDETRRLERLLEGFQTESYGWICSDDVEDVRFLEPSRTFGRDVFLPFLEYWDRRILVRYLGSHLAYEMADGAAGSRAAAETQAAVSREIAREDAAWLSRRFSSQFIAPLVRLNFGYDGPCPTLVISDPA